MVIVRLTRRGAKKVPFYHIVVADSRKPRDGKFIEKLGYYNPLKNEEIFVNTERADYWVKNGAQLSERVKSIMKKYLSRSKLSQKSDNK